MMRFVRARTAVKGPSRELAGALTAGAALCLWLMAWPLAAAPDEYETIEWTELIPAENLEILLNPPAAIAAIPDGSSMDQYPSAGDVATLYGDTEEGRRYQAALESTEVKGELDGRRVRIPGFVVPLAFDETRMISEFFLVPYFGACLHAPPPPPNQIIHSRFGGGLSLNDIYDPFWLEGTLEVGIESTVLGTAAYRMVVDRVSRYEE